MQTRLTTRALICKLQQFSTLIQIFFVPLSPAPKSKKIQITKTVLSKAKKEISKNYKDHFVRTIKTFSQLGSRVGSRVGSPLKREELKERRVKSFENFFKLKQCKCTHTEINLILEESSKFADNFKL